MATNLIVNACDPSGNVIATGDVAEMASSENKDLSRGDVVIPLSTILRDSPIPPMFLNMLKGMTIRLSLTRDDIEWTMADVAREIGNLGFVAPEFLGERLTMIRERCENA